MSVRDLTQDDIARVRAALPGYIVDGQVGRGGCGVVLAGTHRGLNRRVAIKQIPPQFADDMQVRRRFVAEARVMAALDHPHVVPVYDFIEQEDMCLLVLEYLPGGTVESRFVTAGFEATAAVAIALSCAAGLDAAHRNGILHRDVKPSNLMFSVNGTLKLTDFGIAKIIGGEETLVTRAGEIIGTPSYIAPEQVRGQQLSPSTDVYALATMLYQLLSGTLPFPPGADAMAMLFAHAYGDPVPLDSVAPTVPQPIAEAVMRGLASDPAERFDTAEHFGIALAEPAAHCWGTNWLTPVGIPLIGADTIVAAATGGSRPFTPQPFPRPDRRPGADPYPSGGTGPTANPAQRRNNGVSRDSPQPSETPAPHELRPGFGRGWRPTPNPSGGFDSAPRTPPGPNRPPDPTQRHASDSTQRHASDPAQRHASDSTQRHASDSTQRHASDPAQRIASDPIPRNDRPSNPPTRAYEAGERSGPRYPIPPAPHGTRPPDRSRERAAAGWMSGSMARVRPLEPIQHNGVRLVDVDRKDLVPVQRVVTLRSPGLPFAVAAVLAAVVGGAAILGIGSGPGRDLPAPGTVRIAGVDPSAVSRVELDLSKPLPLTVTGVDADAARLSLNVVGVRIGGATTDVRPGTEVEVSPPVNPYVLAGDLTGELTLSRNGSEVAAYRFGVHSTQRATTTATAIGLLLLLLFSVAYAESNARTLRHGSSRIAATVGLTLSGAVLGTAVVGVAWVLLGREPALTTVIVCAAAGAAAGAALAIGCRRIGKRFRYVRVLRMRERS
ncbi:serine/threonine-protein kinase [Nocardia acidivorans]|uniref:serine/threonine-protein kinase n=1 Tax=Nocardia acidivorans TaxID=404580 RepID=UPI00082D2C7F|nr:serine/threonine-protein kinase [Nocardia acidivorans]